MDSLTIRNLVKGLDLKDYRKDFKNILKSVKETLNIGDDLSLSLSVCENDFIAKLNSEYRGINRETDVLSFAIEDDSEDEDILEMTNLTGVREIGDIIINIDRVKSQAKEYGHSERREFCFLFTHGLLHLLGYDHQEKDEEEVMFSLQNEVLNKLGITR